MGFSTQQITTSGGGDPGEGHINMLPFNYSAIGQGTWVNQVNTSSYMNGWFANTSNSDGDNVEYKTYLAAGTYSLRILSLKAPGSPVLDVDIDGVEVASFDLYASSNQYNQLNDQTGITVATSGIKTIKLRADGKNGSSSGYAAYIQCIALWRTA